MEGTDICCEIERRVSDGFVYSEAVTRYARPVQAAFYQLWLLCC